MMINTMIIALVAVLAPILTFYKIAAVSKKIKLPPGPKPWPIIGNLPEMYLHKPVFHWLLNLMEEMNTDIACVRIGKVHVIPVICPKIAQEVCRKQDAIFASRPSSFATNKFSGGYKTMIFSPFSDQWKKMRRVLTTEIICPSRHRWLHDKRSEEADHLVRYVYNQCKDSKNVNVRLVARHYSGNVIRRLIFNKRYFGEPVPDGGPGLVEVVHVDAVFNALAYVYAFCVSDYFPALIGLDLDGHEKIVRETIATLQKFHDPIIDERIQQWRQNSKNKEERELEDLLDVLITLKHEDGSALLSPEEIKAQIIEILIAGVDNPSNAVEWILAEMINNPEILLKAMEEIDTVVGKQRLVEESDIPQLNYIKACIREAFRLHPIDAFIPPHVATEDTTLAGYFIPKGSHVLLSRMGLGRNPKIWDEPLKFKPERHLDDKCSEVVLTEPNLRFISFSTGRRGCIAPALGTAMTVILLARLLQGFAWSKPKGVSSIELAESKENLFLAEPLVLQAEPRLPQNLYFTK